MSGSVVKRGERWSYIIDLPPVDGKRQQRKKGGFRTRRLAEDALAVARVEVIQGYVTADGGQTVGGFMTEWVESIRSSVRATTYDSYDRAIARWINPRLGKIRLRDLTTARLQAFYGELSASGRCDGEGGLSPRSVKLAHQTLLLALRRAVDWHLIPTNPAAGNLALPRGAKTPPKSWTPEEARRFLASVEGDKLAPLWTLMVCTGLRRGEALGLRWDAVNLITGELHVVQTVVMAAGKVMISEPKTQSSRRTIALHPSVVAVLEKHRAKMEERWGPNLGYVFVNTMTSATGGPLHPGRTLLAFHEACKQAGVPQLRLHELRHTAATLALKAGVHPKLVMAMLGHSSIAITLDLYSHVQAGMAKEATDQIGGLLFGEN